MSEKLHRAIKPDAQGFDELRIVTRPRYKESELSGDEWRISASIQLFRKGRLIHEEVGGRNVEVAAGLAYYAHTKAADEGLGYYAGEANLCDQEGCSQPATVAYRLKRGFTRDGSERELAKPGEFRCFCDRHKVRGDCGLEDADDNYEPISLPGQP